jgi:hypothetical protein
MEALIAERLRDAPEAGRRRGRPWRATRRRARAVRRCPTRWAS